MNDTMLREPPPSAPRRRRNRGGPGGPTLAQDASRDGKRLAVLILEVLAGARTPAEAASALGMCVPRYYQLESRALQGVVAACEPRPKGRQPDPVKETQALHKENERLRRELSRQQALLRAAQRTVGLTPPTVAPAKPGAKKPRPRRVARALRVAAQLHQDSSGGPPAAVAEPAPGGQP